MLKDGAINEEEASQEKLNTLFEDRIRRISENINKQEKLLQQVQVCVVTCCILSGGCGYILKVLVEFFSGFNEVLVNSQFKIFQNVNTTLKNSQCRLISN